MARGKLSVKSWQNTNERIICRRNDKLADFTKSEVGFDFNI